MQKELWTMNSTLKLALPRVLPIVLPIIAIMLSSNGYSQDLTLFEVAETAVATSQPRQLEFGVTQTTSPTFTLRSSSRFGDEYRSVIVGSNGESVEVTWSAGEKVVLSGYSGYSVVNVSAKGLSLQLPANDRCVASDATGVSCAGPDISILSLTNKKPLQINGPAEILPTQAVGVVNVDAAEVGPDGERVFFNAFTGAAEAVSRQSDAELSVRDQRARIRSERSGQFQLERISDQDVPPGMRVVRTPFGDRLVPERE